MTEQTDNAAQDQNPGPIQKNQVVEHALAAIVKQGNQTAGPDTGDGSEAGTGEQRKRLRKRKRAGKKTRGGTSAVSHANEAVRELSAMVRQLLDSQKVDFLSRPRFMELTIKVPLDARGDGPRAATRLVDRVLGLVQEVRDSQQALAKGAVYCYFSETSEAETSRPKEPRHVFEGYGSTGRPQFTDFVTMAIERKSKGIDALLAGEEVTLTHVTQGRVLRTAQLAEFGKASPVFRILGQVDAGLFAVRGQESKAAFSFQVLLGKDLHGQVVLRLHPVGMCDVLNLADHSVAQILQRFQSDLDEASLRLRGLVAKGETPDEEEFVLPLLHDLAKRLEDRAKHRSRRTEHADKRSRKSTRPTTKATSDAQSAGDEDILWDSDENTLVVVGSNNRVHVFTPEAKLVTSVTMSRQAAQSRVRSNRWRKTEPSERGEFRMKLRALVKAEEHKPTPSHKPKPDASAAGSQLQSKIAQLMSGLGGGAVSPAAPPAPAATEPAAPEAPAEPTPSEPPPAEPTTNPPDPA